MDALIRITGARDRSAVEHAIASRLSTREQDVITRRYGLRTGQVETLSSIARESGVSVERIRQVEAKAILRLVGRRKVVVSIGLPAGIATAIARLDAFTSGQAPRARVSQLERSVVGLDSESVKRLLAQEMIDDDSLRAAIAIKELAGEVNVLIHALGILLTLGRILEPGEKVISTSLGAGTGGRRYDLETDRRIAEFKFTRWRGSDSVRQRELFADFVNLAEVVDPRRRQLFVTGLAMPRKFLATSNRKVKSVCDRRPEVLDRITAAHGDVYKTVSDYTAAFQDRVELVDLERVLPAYLVDEIAAAQPEPDADEGLK